MLPNSILRCCTNIFYIYLHVCPNIHTCMYNPPYPLALECYISIFHILQLGDQTIVEVNIFFKTFKYYCRFIYCSLRKSLFILYVFCFIILFYLFGETGVELRASCLQSRHYMLELHFYSILP
jgi:hypothetical protein